MKQIGFAQDIGDELDEELAALEVSGAASAPPRARMFVENGNIARLRPIGFGAAQTIAAGATATFTATPQRASQMVRLLVSSDNPNSELALTVLDIGDKSQLLSGEVNGECYDDNAQSGYLLDNFDACPSNTTITISVRNDGAGASVVALTAKARCNGG